MCATISHGYVPMFDSYSQGFDTDIAKHKGASRLNNYFATEDNIFSQHLARLQYKIGSNRHNEGCYVMRLSISV